MALSPNYSWAEPDNSSLVKNGAADIRTLGDAIDTSLWNVGYGQAGKNKIINGDCAINQRNFSSTTSSGSYIVDRFIGGHSGGTVTYSVQQFTPGAAPVAGYEAKQFMRLVVSGQSAAGDFATVAQEIEDVRTFAGQTVTISFWAKANTGTPGISVDLLQKFGSGGSPSSSVSTAAGKNAITTSWARYSYTVAVPSISGKTIGTTDNTSSLRLRVWVSAGSTYNTETTSLGTQANTFDIWGVQVEKGTVATPFEVRPVGLELSLCQRYFERFNNTGALSQIYYTNAGYFTNSASPYTAIVTINYQTEKRVEVTPTVTGTMQWLTTGASPVNASSVTFNGVSKKNTRMTIYQTTNAVTAGTPTMGLFPSGVYMDVNAEL